MLAQHRRKISILLLAGVVIGTAGCGAKHPPVVEVPPAVVMVSEPVQRNVTSYQIFTIRTQAVESVEVKARVTGYLTKILFKDGDDVTEGEVLFEIDDRPYKASLDQAAANLEYAKASLIEAQANYDIAAAVRKANAAAMSEQELNKRLGAKDEAVASVKQAQAALEQAQLNYGWCKVTAPISGRADRHFIDVGNLVTQDVTTLTNIVSIKPIWAYFDVDQNTALEVQTLVAKGEMKSARNSVV